MKKRVGIILKKIFKKAGYTINRLSSGGDEQQPKILTDVFGSGSKKKVLISYIQQPFKEGIKYHHTNYLECYTAAEVFHELGYAVDVADLFDDGNHIEFNNYQVVYGLGRPMEKIYYTSDPERILKIFYSTGCNPFYSYKASALQVQRFYSETGKLIPQSSRIGPDFWTFQYTLSDFIIALGNDFVAKTFLDVNPSVKCEPVHAFYFDVYNIDIEKKDFGKSKNNFLWFGSMGLLHKGLDLLIDIFSKRPDICLHICGLATNEIKFREYYDPIIKSCDNITDHGFIDINSDSFKNIMEDCTFCVFPTASEGGAPALLNVMANGGLIPLASRECGIDIDDFGLVFKKLDHQSISSVIEDAGKLSTDQIREKALLVKDTVREKYTYAQYKINIADKIKKAVQLFEHKTPASNHQKNNL